MKVVGHKLNSTTVPLLHISSIVPARPTAVATYGGIFREAVVSLPTDSYSNESMSLTLSRIDISPIAGIKPHPLQMPKKDSN